VLVRHRAGSYWVDVWLGGRLVRASVIGFVSLNQDWLNRDIHGVLRFAPNTDVEPWPVRPGMADSRKDMTGKETLMADKPTVEQEILAGLAELRHGLAILGDQIAALTARLDGQPPQPHAPAEDPDVEFWRMFFSTPLPDAETFTPEAFTSYDRGRVLYQWLANHTPLGKRIYRDVAGEMATLRVMWEDSEDRRSLMFQEAGVDFETAVYAILSGRCDDLFATGFGARPRDQIAAIAGKSAADLFAADIAADKQGGTPGIGG